MKAFLLVTMSLFLSFGTMTAQTKSTAKRTTAKSQSSPTRKLEKFSVGSKYGLLSGSTVVVPAKYDRIGEFGLFEYNRMALVKMDSKYGLINSSGTVVVPCKYDEIDEFDVMGQFAGLAKVKLNGNYGFINKAGKEVIPCRYSWIGYGFKNGLLDVVRNGKHGFVSTSGVEVVPCKYDYADSFSDGMAIVEMNGKSGAVNTSGTLVVPCKYDVLYDFHEGLAVAKQNGNFVYINKTGSVVISNKGFSSVEDFHEGLAWVKRNGKYLCINKSGSVVINEKDYYSVNNFSEGLACVQLVRGGPKGFIDKTGRMVIPAKYDLFTQKFHEGFCVANSGDKMYLLDKQGNAASAKYDWICSFEEGLCEVKMGDKWGYMNTSGKIVIPIQYSRVTRFMNGVAHVELNGNSFYIDKQGNKK